MFTKFLLNEFQHYICSNHPGICFIIYSLLTLTLGIFYSPFRNILCLSNLSTFYTAYLWVFFSCLSKHNSQYVYYVKWKKSVKVLVTQLCLTLCDPMDCSLPGSFAHGIFQARVLEWGAIAFSECQATSHENSWREIFIPLKQKACKMMRNLIYSHWYLRHLLSSKMKGDLIFGEWHLGWGYTVKMYTEAILKK